MAATKVCSHCRTEKPITEFGRSSERKDGLKPWCKQCRKAECARDFQRHKEKRLAKHREWVANNPGRMTGYVKAYQAREPDKTRANNLVCNHRRRHAEGSFRAEDVNRIRELQRDRCAMSTCRARLGGLGHVDHIIPLAKGGTHHPRNLQLLCSLCNHRKHGKDPLVFARENGLLL